METISMSAKERARLEVFSRVRAGEMTLVKAGEILSLSDRQTKRSWSRFREQGDAGLVHPLRGKASNQQPTAEELLANQSPPMQFGRSLRELNVRLIMARSPQAKGRVERMNGTLQDRLVKALHRANVCDLTAANCFLEEAFLPSLNERFSIPAAKTPQAVGRNLSGAPPRGAAGKRRLRPRLATLVLRCSVPFRSSLTPNKNRTFLLVRNRGHFYWCTTAQIFSHWQSCVKGNGNGSSVR